MWVTSFSFRVINRPINPLMKNVLYHFTQCRPSMTIHDVVKVIFVELGYTRQCKRAQQAADESSKTLYIESPLCNSYYEND